MTDRSRSVRELEQRLQPKLLNGICSFVLDNETPAEWQAVVVAGGAKFFYRDGTDYTDGPKPINVPTGSNYTFFSNDPAECVEQVTLAITVDIPSEGPANLVYTSEIAPQGQCWTRLGVTLAPTALIPEADLKREHKLQAHLQWVPKK